MAAWGQQKPPERRGNNRRHRNGLFIPNSASTHLNIQQHEGDLQLQVVVMSQRDVIDFSALERELQAAVESDHRYQRENDTKLRAVSQRVSYEQFRGLVLSSHLKPLDRKDQNGAPRKQPWNAITMDNAQQVLSPRATKTASSHNL